MIAALLGLTPTGRPIPPVTRKPLPESIERDMKRWRHEGCWAKTPQSYQDWHATVAAERLVVLATAMGLRVALSHLVHSGWLDGMKELEAQVQTPSGKWITLVWHDGNQDFMRRFEDHGGSGILLPGDLD